MSELVSCVLATGNRNRFFAQALRCFSAQTYPHRELIVVDDGDEPVSRQCAGVGGVTYLRLDRPTPTGAKLNLAIENARGAILQKIDDDDYYRPGFLAAAVAGLRSGDWRRSIAAWDCFLILVPGETRLRFSGHGWMAGGTLCFSRAVWEQKPFREIPADEDHWFLRDHLRRPRIRVRAPELYVLVRHGANTWRRLPNGVPVDDWVRDLAPYPKRIAQVVDAEARALYDSLVLRRIRG